MTRFLPQDDQRAFAADLTHALVASGELDCYSALSELLREWRASAEIHTDPRLAGRLRGALVADGMAVAARPAG